MMKKIIALVLIAALVLSLGTAAVFAANPITTANGSDSKDVKGSYQAGGASTTIYSVDVSWGNMEFTYTGASEGTWNPSTHTFDGSVPAAWTCSEGENTITVTNHSNTTVTASFAYAADSAYSTIDGQFDKPTLNLASAVDTTVANAPKGSAALTLTGELANTVTTSTKLGTVTVTLS